MKKGRALLGVILPILALTLSACDLLPTNLFGGKGSSQQSSSRRIRSNQSSNYSSYNDTHVHRFSEEWSYNSQTHWHDSLCGHNVKSDVGRHDIYSETIKEATCRETGQRIDICTICGYEATVTVPVSDHTWSEYEHKEPTCTENGYSKKFCTVCNVFSEEILYPTGHDFDDVLVLEPTCTQEGIIQRTCKVCGYVEQYYTGSYGHDLQLISRVDSTCSSHGYERYQCLRCGEVIDYSLPFTSHRWSGNVTSMDSGNGAPYTTDNCIYCGAQKFTLLTRSGTIVGSEKGNLESNYGYIKLASNGNSINIDFDSPINAYVRIYQHAIYDGWKYESQRYYTYRNGASGSEFNFSMEVNGNLVDLSEASNYTYYDYLNDSGEYIEELINNNYSPAGDCLIGDATIVQGLNHLTYTRLGSYCLSVDSFVLVVTSTNHVHSIGSGYYYDDTYHWQYCSDPNCPISGGVIDKSVHSFEYLTAIPGGTCNDVATIVYQCSVCGYQMSTTEPYDHSYDYESTSYITNSVGYQLAVNQCNRCGKIVESFDFSLCSIESGNLKNYKLDSGTTIIWKIPVLRAGLISIYLPMRLNSTSSLTQEFNPDLYSIRVNDVYCGILLPYCYYQDLGINMNYSRYLNFANYEVTENDLMRGEIDIAFTSNVSNYRPMFEGELRIEY